MSVDFTKVPVGTRVETAWGPGKIVLTNNKNPYPVMVTLDNSDAAEMYTADGRYVTHEKRPTLFLAPFEWPTQEQPPPPLKLAVDYPVMVRQTSEHNWEKRHFAGWEGQRIVTFPYGQTSFTTKTKNTAWRQWRLPTEEELKERIIPS
jgi:hypothetical protein